MSHSLRVIAHAIAGVVICFLCVTSCDFSPNAVKLSYVLSNDFKGFAVFIQDESGTGKDTYTLSVSNDKRTTTYISNNKYSRFVSIKYENGMPLVELAEAREGEVGYKWIQRTGPKTWLFVGTREELATKKNQVIEIEGHSYALW